MAAKARRIDESAEIHVFERGPSISFANCGLPYFISREIDRRDQLIIMTPERLWERSRVHAHLNHEVLSINRATKTIHVKGPDGAGRDEPYDKLILSPGARPVVPPIPGVRQPHVFTLRDIPDMDRIIRFLEEKQPRHAVVIGGGFLLDVRDPDEVLEYGRLGNAVNIPLAQLRDRLGELPHDRRIVTYCQKGQRGYLAACALLGRGFDKVANLRGGYLQARLNG